MGQIYFGDNPSEWVRFTSALTACLVVLLSAGSALAQVRGASIPSLSDSAPAISGSTAGTMGNGSQEVHQSMVSGGKTMQDMPMSGDVDKDFAMIMRAHHQQAVEMAQAQIEKGKTPEQKRLARKIIAAQKKEIAPFDRGLAAHK